MKLLDRLQAKLEELTTKELAPLNDRVAEAKADHNEHLDILHAEEEHDEALNTIVRTVRLEALRIKQYVDRKEVYKLAGSTYPLHPHKNAAVLQSHAQKLEDQSVAYGIRHGMTADEVRSLVRDVWQQTMSGTVSTAPLQAIIAANKPYIPSVDPQLTFEPSPDAIKWLELAKAEYQHRVDWEWNPQKAKELLEEFIDNIKYRASRSIEVVWQDGTKRARLTMPELNWLEQQIRRYCGS